MNIAEIESSVKDLVSKPFDAASFPFDFMAVFDAPKSTITKLRQAQPADLLGGPPEVHWKRKLLFRPAPKGKAAQTLEALRATVSAGRDMPRFILSTDGHEFVARDLKLDQSLDIEFAKANDAFDFFLPLAGIERYQGVPESQADVRATGRVAKLYDAILEANSDWRDAGRTHSLNLFMTRLLFCFFAEATSIFEHGLFTQTAMTVSREDGADFASTLGSIFEALSRNKQERDGLPEFARRFPYVNGGLFADRAPIPAFSRRARRLFRECGELSWAAINPDIFGSMIQAVVEPGMRGDMGMHYTSVPNIMKALHPLFLLSLEEDLDAARDSEAKLMRLLKRIYSIRVFDPACGSGNFLIISYRELRNLESRVFERLTQLGKGAIPMTGVHLSQFYGIELADFAAETAKLSLWISEYQMNERFKAQFGVAPPALPLRDSGTIVHGNALQESWLAICPPKEGTETYIVGNPPYLGSANQTAGQKADMDHVFAGASSNYRNLDYVAAWYVRAAYYAQKTNAQAAFVATNSICQGEQVAMLWPLVFGMGMEIGFAHQPFKWRNNAAHVAGVTCVIVGIRPRATARKILYSTDTARIVRNIGPYLLEMDDVYVQKESRPINGLPPMDWGSKPADDGNLIIESQAEHDTIVAASPKSKSLVRNYVGAKEFIQGHQRWCLWIDDQHLKEAMRVPSIAARIERVAEFRGASKKAATVDLASFPYRFSEVRHSDEDLIVVPIHFSEDRDYFTVGFLDGRDTIVSNACYAVYGAHAHAFALLSSRLHAVWVSTVCGGLETRIRYSNTLGYHTFPVPALSDAQRSELEDHAWAIMAARESHPGKTIAWLYDPETMPEGVLEAHRALDETLERICIGRPFRNDTERLEYLFKQYVAMKRKGRNGATAESAPRGVRA
ncbi:class I SAM-dependent DNA methyltransferase [Burkholderia contaminans]|uniref:DNA methyltransferase n=1 Tax=Burkholderia cepacia complex TaxID=87882 RepID=UPI001041878B|nr:MULTISPECIES: DNA methyltransferase [Burkholderia cepacia complex]MBH9724827.1 class I SAM-dependent DNA methyltransferase [Burkholderia contaminans]MBR8094186.1 class I SAM-dependent DNA methyltransferase [Burkholderia cenocepacia]MBY4710670.1 N-6 DNA methylase [Burkholderia cepacia]MBY4737148.1 N-6 DNA methylase [Burkholderia cepacia]MBY4744486.1 N-6 DNA methylase [Burkholderia cepacia]